MASTANCHHGRPRQRGRPRSSIASAQRRYPGARRGRLWPRSSILAITALLVLRTLDQFGRPAVKFGWNFLFTPTWDPVAEQFGALPFIYGTVVTSLAGAAHCRAAGVGAAIFLAELAPPRISDALTF